MQFWASRNGDLEVVKFLHANSADMTARNNSSVREASGRCPNNFRYIDLD